MVRPNFLQVVARLLSMVARSTSCPSGGPCHQHTPGQSPGPQVSGSVCVPHKISIKWVGYLDASLLLSVDIQGHVNGIVKIKVESVGANIQPWRTPLVTENMLDVFP